MATQKKSYTWLWLLAGAAVLYYLYSRGILSGLLGGVTGSSSTASAATNSNTATVSTVASGALTSRTGSTQTAPATTTGVVKSGTVPTYKFTLPASGTGSTASGYTGGIESTGGTLKTFIPGQGKSSTRGVYQPALSASQWATLKAQMIKQGATAANIAAMQKQALTGHMVYVSPGFARSPSHVSYPSVSTGVWTGPVVVKQGTTGSGTAGGSTTAWRPAVKNWGGGLYTGPLVRTVNGAQQSSYGTVSA